MKKIIALLLALVMVFALIGCGGSSAPAASGEEKKTLVFGTSADYAPFEFMYPDESGNMVYGGIDVSVAQYIADYLGMELQTENMDFGYLLTALNKGDFDMVLADIEATEARLAAVDMSDPYMVELPNKFLIRAEDADKYTTIDSFAGKNVGAQAGSTKVDYIANDCPGANCVTLSLVPDMVNELVSGKLDAILLDGNVAVNYAQTNPDLAVAGASEFYADDIHTICVAVAKGDPKGLLPGINEAIAKLTAEDKIAEFEALADALSGVAEEVSGIVPEGYTPDA
ncbi:MAG: transporter substrate-binding domain-containing protein [Oscillospiraceae bacterium]|nr:transporter substrate-binding domain-containing protein [Oscillospiraceae bacterium]